MTPGTTVGINNPESVHHGKIGKIARNFDSGWYIVRLDTTYEEIGAYGSELKELHPKEKPKIYDPEDY